ncbi:Divergent polysaccharide deacetylase [Rhabdaerophilaceae bacterium]
MTVDSLSTPLGMKPNLMRKAARVPFRRRLFYVLLLIVSVVLVTIAVRSTRQSTSPVAIVRIERSPEGPESTRVPELASKTAPEQSPSRDRSTGSEIEDESGVRVVRQHGGQAPGAAVIRVPDQSRDSERLVPAPDGRLSERVAFGILPKTAFGGITPRGTYARPFVATAKPKIAIILTGVGVSARSTADAIARLPGEITLAFAPYGRDLEPQVMRARRDGHEVLLQVPMEPFDFPDSDPGPHTLRTTGSAKENMDRLHWLMSRFTGYVGIMNFMGGKLMSNPQSLQPLFEDINRRGLLFLDDGSTRQTRASEVAGRVGLPALRADKVIDVVGGPQQLSVVLADAEAQAARNGHAIVAVPALPANIDAIARWERDLASRNIVLAPVSALYSQPRP